MPFSFLIGRAKPSRFTCDTHTKLSTCTEDYMYSVQEKASTSVREVLTLKAFARAEMPSMV